MLVFRLVSCVRINRTSFRRSLDAYFSSGGEKDYRFVSGNEN